MTYIMKLLLIVIFKTDEYSSEIREPGKINVTLLKSDLAKFRNLTE